MNQQIDQVVKRAYGYFYRDGLVEISVGGLFLVVGLLLQLFDPSLAGSPVPLIAGIGLPLLTIGGALLINRAVKEIKERVTYPRTGYISYHKEKPSRARWLIPGVAFALLVTSFFLPERLIQMALWEGVMLFAVLSIIGYRVGVKRFYLLGALAALIGLSATLGNTGDLLGSTVTFAGTGLAMVISGGVVLLSFLRRYPKPAGSQE